MPISSTLRGSFPTVGSSECCKIRLHLRPWASSLFWSSETQIANAWFPCLRQKQGEIPERSCCFKCWPLTSEVCRFCSLSWRLSPQGVRLGHPNSRTGVSSASLLSTRLLRSAIPSGLLMPQMVLCLRCKLVKGITVHMSMKKYILGSSVLGVAEAYPWKSQSQVTVFFWVKKKKSQSYVISLDPIKTTSDRMWFYLFSGPCFWWISRLRWINYKMTWEVW